MEEYARLKLALVEHLQKEQWTKMAELLLVPPGKLEKFETAKDLFTWMENHRDSNGLPFLSSHRLDKLSELLGDSHVGAAAALDVLAKYPRPGNY